jgi:hypothetical protein
MAPPEGMSITPGAPERFSDTVFSALAGDTPKIATPKRVALQALAQSGKKRVIRHPK